MRKKFSKWVKWRNREELGLLKFHGVYSLAISRRNLEGTPHNFEKEICYFGMSCSKKGVNGRLKQFDNTIKGKRGHGGASRFIYQHPDYNKLIQQLYVSVDLFEFGQYEKRFNDESSYTRRFLIEKHEMDCMYKYLNKHDALPLFNDYDKAPKK